VEVIKYYKKYVVENSSLITISAIIAFLLRLSVYYIYTDPSVYSIDAGYLWNENVIDFLSRNRAVSALLSIFSTFVVVFYSGHINAKHKLIRSRSYLIYVFSLLLSSCHPVFLYMTPQYISLILIMLCTDMLLDTYQRPEATGKAYSIGFVIAIGSLFSFYSFLYLPIFWIGMKMMRSFNFKTFMTSLLGVLTIYWLVFFYLLFNNDIGSIQNPINSLSPFLSNYIENISVNKVIALLSYIFLLIIMLGSYINKSFHDKIQTRANLSFFFMIAIFSFLAVVFINYDPILNLYILIFSSSVLMAHFFSLILEKWKIILLYTIVTLYFIMCIYYLFSKTIITLLAV